MTMIDTKAGIEGYRLCAMRAALKLEILGLKHSRGSVYALIKRQFGFRGNKQSVLEQLNAHIGAFNKANGFGETQ